MLNNNYLKIIVIIDCVNSLKVGRFFANNNKKKHETNKNK